MSTQVKEKVEAFLKIATEGLSRSEFVNAFKTLTAFVQKVKEGLEVRFIVLEEKLDTKVSKLKDGYTPVKGKDYFDGKDGKDGIGIIGAKGDKGEQGESIQGLNGADGSPDTPKLIRDKLEFLKEEEKLSIEAVRDLEERLQKLEERPLGGKSGWGFAYSAMDRHFFDNETPTGTVNGTNKAFTLTKAPNPSASLKVYVNQGRMYLTIDYTFSSQTITFNTAPPTGSIIEVDYRA